MISDLEAFRGGDRSTWDALAYAEDGRRVEGFKRVLKYD